MKLKVIEAGRYLLEKDFEYYSERYDGHITVKAGEYDGASGPAIDIVSDAWLIHDQICNDPFFDKEKYRNERRPITAYMAAQILSDVLASEGRWVRAMTWKWSTFLFGCTRTRANGWF